MGEVPTWFGVKGVPCSCTLQQVFGGGNTHIPGCIAPPFATFLARWALAAWHAFLAWHADLGTPTCGGGAHLIGGQGDHQVSAQAPTPCFGRLVAPHQVGQPGCPFDWLSQWFMACYLGMACTIGRPYMWGMFPPGLG